MSAVAPVISAVAATAAAAFSASTLYVAGRRDKRKWHREMLSSALVKFLGASFTGSTTKVYLRLEANEDISDWFENSVKAHEAQTRALTELRLIAPLRIVNRAVALHEADHRVRNFLRHPPQPLSQAAFGVVKDEQRKARQSMLDASRKTLGLEVGIQPSHGYHPDDS